MHAETTFRVVRWWRQKIKSAYVDFFHCLKTASTSILCVHAFKGQFYQLSKDVVYGIMAAAILLTVIYSPDSELNSQKTVYKTSYSLVVTV
jgi:hypothetical protein